MLAVAAVGALALGGCRAVSQLPGLYRATGNLPGITPTMLAYTYYQGQAAQVYQFSVPQVHNSLRQALADLGFYAVEARALGNCIELKARTPDGRIAKMTVGPQNALTLFTIWIACPFGDEPLSKAVIDRIALNLGALPRQLIPLEQALARRGSPREIPYRGTAPEVPEPIPVDPLDMTPAGPFRSAAEPGPGAEAELPQQPVAPPPNILINPFVPMNTNPILD
jgi:hypothetical protein